ncbi:MAG: ATP-grasp domain-containing protein [Chloroflexota bacterium]
MTATDRVHRDPGPSPRGSVLLVGNYLPSIAVARALAAQGYHVIAGDGGEYSTVFASRACHEVWRHDPSRAPGVFLGELLALLAARPDIRVVMPLITDYVEIVAGHRPELPPGIVVASPQPEVIEVCLDKARMLELVRSAGVPERPTLTAGDAEGVLAAAREVGLPCVVRPGAETGTHLPHERKALICEDEAAVRRAVEPWPPGIPSLMVQPYVDGPRHNVYFAAREGRIVGSVQSRIVRTDRHDGTGTNVEAIILASQPRVTELSEAIVGRLGYTGVGLLQFLVPATGDPHFLELNPRHGAGVAFMIAAGLDLATAAIELARPGGTWAPPAGWSPPVGLRYAWVSRDLYGLLAGRERAEVSPAEGRRWFRNLVRSGVRADVHGTWDLHDPAPTLTVYRHLLRDRPWRARA